MKGPLMLLFCLASSVLSGQAGTQADPFTALGNAHYVNSSGIYYFNVGGTSFSTYVEAGNGWMLIASGNAATTESSYTYTTSLTLQSDKILPASIYNTSSLVTAVRMNASSGPDTPFDVQSVNSSVLNNLKNNRTLSHNTNAANWTGTGTARLERGCASNNSSLSTRIYHACGMGTNMHWQVGQFTEQERVNLGSGAKNDLNLWVSAAPVGLLPVELVSFEAVPLDRTVALKWQTASETGNDYFLVERSANGRDWEEALKVDGAGDATNLHTYNATDFHPYPGVSYYRLKQTDFDGQFTFSPIAAVAMELRNHIPFRIFPNPSSGLITLEGDKTDVEEFKMYTLLGKEVTHHLKMENSGDNQIVLDISALPPGIFLLKTKSGSHRICKR